MHLPKLILLLDPLVKQHKVLYTESKQQHDAMFNKAAAESY